MNSATSALPAQPGTVRFLGGPDYAIRVAENGAGSSVSGDLLLTLGQEAGPAGLPGLRVHVRDLETGKHIMIGQKAGTGAGPADPIGWRWQPGLCTIAQDLAGVEARLDTCVAAKATFELRRVTLTNRSARARVFDVTTFAEVVLNTAGAHQSHPSFSKLFLQTEFDTARSCLSVRRRPRSPQDAYPILFHACLGLGAGEHETSRPAFVGRGRHHLRPAALESTGPLSGTTGIVLDPIVSLRRSCRLEPGGQEEFVFVLGVAADTAAAARLVDSLQPEAAVATVFTDAALAAEQQLRQAGLSVTDDQYYQDLAGAVLCRRSGVAPRRDALKVFGDHREALVRLGLSLDRDWVVVHAETPEGAANEAVMRRVAARWRQLALPIQVVFIKDGDEPAHNDAESNAESDAPANELTIQVADLTPAEFQLLNLAAGLIITEAMPKPGAARPAAALSAPPPADIVAPHRLAGEPLRFENGLGGFNAAGDEYVIRLKRDPAGHLILPPVPWTNVIANDDFGFVVSETGAGSTWCLNSRENRLTPWANDAVRDPHGDGYYLRDEETGAAWSCLPGPTPGNGDYEVRHGFGYSRFRHVSAELALDTTMFVPRTDPLRITRITVVNTGDRPRRLSLFGGAQLVLGGDAPAGRRFITTWQDDQTGALLARNAVSATCPQCVAFAAVVTETVDAQVHHTCSLTSFLGAGGDFSAPAALTAATLDGSAATELGSCFAHQAVFTLDPGQSATISFLLGQEGGADWARELVIRYTSAAVIETARQEAVDFWRDGLSALQVQTPSTALDLMVNGWLPYQTLSCRIRGRTAFYQSGGAFGFRDQLQDSSSLVPLWPEKTRQQILLHAGHQFVEGDVMHWWHTPHGQGIRTRFADDLLWLPLLTAEYVAATGDREILSETAPYLTARQLVDGEDEVFLQPTLSGEVSDLYEHCCRAIDRSLKVGRHGLPLFGTGDWNDGMNRVGREGKGESVWMGFFLVMVLDGFVPLCRQRGEDERAERYENHVRQLKLALNDAGWDGGWYRRGYYDNGAPLGSHLSDECRIDALAQAWAVLSEVAPADRAEQALQALEEHLVVADPGLIKLLTPPFVDTPNDPGYIKGYVAGVRENGGQYTHAALWVVRAMAKAGRRDRAAALLDLLNPILHAQDQEQVAVYQAEPYVVAADVYGAEPHVGRGGWTWYTGSSGWMHRVAVESVLGLRLEGGDTLALAPCVPDDWPAYTLTWRRPGTTTSYRIHVTNPDGCSAAVVSATLDGQPLAIEPGTLRIPLADDGRNHEVLATLGTRTGAEATS